MVDVSVMLGADERAAEAQMKLVLDFEMELAKVRSKTPENLKDKFLQINGIEKDNRAGRVLDASMECVLFCRL